MTAGRNEAVIRVRDLVVGFGTSTVLDHLSLDVFRGEILGFVGGSGAGKSVLMRTIIGLLPKRAGAIEVFGADRIEAGSRLVEENDFRIERERARKTDALDHAA